MGDFRLFFSVVTLQNPTGSPAPIRPKLRNQTRKRLFAILFIQLAFPYHMNAPAVRLKRFDIAPVTLDVAFEFRNPVLLIAFRHGRLAVWTTVPKASVDEQGHLFTRIGDVGTPRNAPLKTIARKRPSSRSLARTSISGFVSFPLLPRMLLRTAGATGFSGKRGACITQRVERAYFAMYLRCSRFAVTYHRPLWPGFRWRMAPKGRPRTKRAA